MTMAQLRYGLVALTLTTTTDPAALLEHLNRMLLSGGEPARHTRTATAVVARLEPATGVLTWAQAGHPAPLRNRAGRSVELTRPAGPLLGVSADVSYHNAVTTLKPGDVLVLYTDGLVENRGRSMTEGLAAVIAALDEVATSGDPQPLASLLARLPQANPDDDTCVLAARVIDASTKVADLGSDTVTATSVTLDEAVEAYATVPSSPTP
jgi:serine phosphatase RsbU (regulator of sigma subunit)